MPFIDIHTHQIDCTENEMAIFNVDDMFTFDFQNNKHLLSVGIHPGVLQPNYTEKSLQFLKEIVHNKNVLMIGECGLDRNIKVDFDLQRKVFIQQLELAETIKKPVIIHCVRAFDELILIKKQHNPSVPMIIHGFNNNIDIALKIIENGFYVSLGSQLHHSGSNPAKTIESIPLNRLFLESDDKNHSISSIFAVASSILNVKPVFLEEAIRKNYETIFYATDSL